jgi:hypothetical protein
MEITSIKLSCTVYHLSGKKRVWLVAFFFGVHMNSNFLWSKVQELPLQFDNGYTDLHQTWHTYSFTLGRTCGNHNAESVLSSIPGDGVFSTSETKHDGTVQRA